MRRTARLAVVVAGILLVGMLGARAQDDAGRATGRGARAVCGDAAGSW